MMMRMRMKKTCAHARKLDSGSGCVNPGLATTPILQHLPGFRIAGEDAHEARDSSEDSRYGIRRIASQLRIHQRTAVDG